MNLFSSLGVLRLAVSDNKARWLVVVVVSVGVVNIFEQKPTQRFILFHLPLEALIRKIKT